MCFTNLLFEVLLVLKGVFREVPCFKALIRINIYDLALTSLKVIRFKEFNFKINLSLFLEIETSCKIL